MMKIPPPPLMQPLTPKPPLFPEAAKMSQEKELGDSIRGLCEDLYKATHIPGWQDTLLKFKAAVAPGGAFDVTRLPHVASGPTVKYLYGNQYMPLACLYTKLSWLIQRYWRLCLQGSTHEELSILRDIQKIRNIMAVDHDLPMCLLRGVIHGDVKLGWWMEAN